MTKTAKEILEPIVNMAYRAGQNNDHPNNANIHKVVDTALKELEAIHQQEIAKARIDEWRLISEVTHSAGLTADMYISQARGDRIAELSQTLKEHKENN